jgi:cation diffusion facilitator CzcD-associated flavoprotein CzcO
VSFNARVNGCTWDAGASKWKVRMETGVTACAQFLILATGLLHRAYVPTWPGQEKYCGVMLHSGAWPEDTDVSGKHVAIIGAGSTSVQITQELGKTAAQLTVLLRRPSYCLPMGQRAYTDVEQDELRAYYPALFAAGRKSFTGLPMERQDARAQDVSAEERERYFESTWKIGGFHFLLRGYNNVMLDKEANKIVYDYWRKKTLKRLTDVKKQEIMAPGVMPYYFSTKRSPLEQDYYEVLNQDNVEVVDLNEHPIKSFTEWGMQLGGEDGGREFDYIICATGYDSYTGSVTNMGLISKDGVGLKEVWKDGVRTHLGMTIHGFPNAFMVYSPQAPTALANGPTIIGESLLQ